MTNLINFNCYQSLKIKKKGKYRGKKEDKKFMSGRIVELSISLLKIIALIMARMPIKKNNNNKKKQKKKITDRKKEVKEMEEVMVEERFIGDRSATCRKATIAD